MAAFQPTETEMHGGGCMMGGAVALKPTNQPKPAGLQKALLVPPALVCRPPCLRRSALARRLAPVPPASARLPFSCSVLRLLFARQDTRRHSQNSVFAFLSVVQRGDTRQASSLNVPFMFTPCAIPLFHALMCFCHSPPPAWRVCSPSACGWRSITCPVPWSPSSSERLGNR